MEMKLPILQSSILVFQIFLEFTFGNSFVIDRNGHFDRSDSFVIPPSICDQGGSTGHQCEPFQANELDLSCSCYCSAENATFVFHHNNWTCLAHDEVRKLQDCNKRTFFTEGETNPPSRLLGLHVNDGVIRALDIPFGEPTGWEQCELNLNRSWVLGCDGSRLRSSRYLSKMMELFSFPEVSQSHYFSLQVTGEVPGARMLQGRIVNLGIRCTNSSQHQYHGCLMFKLTGQQTCPVSMPNPERSFTPSVQKTTLTETEVFTFSPTTIDIPSTTIAPHSTAAGGSFVTSPADVRPQPTLGRDRGQKTTNGFYFLILTAGITASPLLIVLCIFGLMVYCRRRSNRRITRANIEKIRRRNRQDAIVMNALRNSAFQGDDETGYKILTIDGMERQISWYASTYSVPRHLSTKRDNLVLVPFSARGDIREDEGRNTCGPANSQEPLYYVIEEPTPDNEAHSHSQRDGYSCSQQPVYIVTREISNAEGPKGPTNSGAEPGYNLWEDPNLEDNNGTAQYGSMASKGPDDSENTTEPVYYVLEDDTGPSISAC